MKKRELDELRKKTTQELKSLLAEREKELIKLKIDLSLRKIKNVHAVALAKKELAQIKTLISEKELMEEK